MPTSSSGGVLPRRRVVTGAGGGVVAVAPTTSHNAGGSGGLGSGVVVDAIIAGGEFSILGGLCGGLSDAKTRGGTKGFCDKNYLLEGPN